MGQEWKQGNKSENYSNHPSVERRSGLILEGELYITSLLLSLPQP